MKVSLITTERNEVDSIADFIESAQAQSLQPDEIVIADGGSTDGTIEVIEQYAKKDPRIKLVIAPGNRSIGRNAATEAASNEVVAVTDVGCRLDIDWLKHITEPFHQNPNAMAVAGFFVSEPKTYFEKVSAELMLSPNDKIDLETWLPSSRSVAYKKEAWRKAGGYPTHTNFNEDTPFDLALKRAGYKFEDGLKAIVYWRPRPTLREFYRQYYFYAVGDGLDRIASRMISGLTIKYGLLTAVTAALFVYDWRLAWIAPAFLIVRHIKRVWRPHKRVGGLRALLLMAFLITAYDISQLHGYWTGRLRRNELSHSQKLVR